MAELRADGKRVLVTAGASGIGRVIAETLLDAGAKIHICDIDQPALASFRQAWPEAGATLADVANDTQVDRLFHEAGSGLGGLDALVNNAGIAGPTGAIEDIDPAEWRRCLEVGLTSQFLCARRAVPMLKAAGGGAMVNISSVAGRLGYPFRTPYAAAKWGVIGLTQSLAKELGPSNISVNAILPGLVEGPRIEGVIRARAQTLGISFEEMEKQYLERVSLRRMVSPNDVANMVLFLVSPFGRNISGQSLSVCGNVETL
ncbi:MAG: SDR family oxidoreductase [Acetobacteraceae bacterium]|nr:SDR family oxidoreductase [Acetobacteraceae bacterium]MBV8591662.1 SDR family oxidoreductase [Acetobacteraceae bacterium]